jgi:hypothetical protein
VRIKPATARLIVEHGRDEKLGSQTSLLLAIGTAGKEVSNAAERVV